MTTDFTANGGVQRRRISSHENLHVSCCIL